MREKKEARQPASKTGNTIKVKRKYRKRIKNPVLVREWFNPTDVIVYPKTTKDD